MDVRHAAPDDLTERVRLIRAFVAHLRAADGGRKPWKSERWPLYSMASNEVGGPDAQ